MNQNKILIQPAESEDKNSKRIAKNFFFNAIYQFFLIALPLVLTPYVSRVLQPSGVGHYSYSSSLITYFTLFAAFGFNVFGQREIAKKQNDKKLQSIVFFEIVFSRLLFVFFALTLHISLFFTGVYGNYSSTMLVLSVNVISVAFDISFLFQGNEQFGKLTLRNVAIKLLGLVAIFVFVKSHNDLFIYTLISVLTTLISNLYLWFLLPRIIQRVSIHELKIWETIKKSFLLFLPTIVISIYTVLDKTMIGIILKNDDEVGFYEQAEKLVKMVLVILTCLGTVMIPRNSAEFEQKNIEKVKKNIYFAIQFVWLLGTPLMFGIIAISENMNLWFFGPGYQPVVLMMMLLSPLVMAIGLNNVLGIQYLIPSGKEKIFTLSTIVGAATNLILNIVLLIAFGTIGAVIASVISESVIFIFQLVYLRKVFSVSRILLCGWKNIVSGLVMFIVVYFVGKTLDSSLLNTLKLVLIGVEVYSAMILALRDKMALRIINTLLRRK